jgi:hypothetical protein
LLDAWEFDLQELRGRRPLPASFEIFVNVGLPGDALANASGFTCTLGNFGNKRRPLPVYRSVSTLDEDCGVPSSHIEAGREKGNAVSNVLEHWIPVGCDAYDENVFMPWIKESL